MSVDGMKKLIWVTIGIFVAFIVLWLYASKLDKMTKEKPSKPALSSLNISIEGETTSLNIWEYLGDKQAENTSTSGGAPVTDENGETVTDERGNVVTNTSPPDETGSETATGDTTETDDISTSTSIGGSTAPDSAAENSISETLAETVSVTE